MKNCIICGVKQGSHVVWTFQNFNEIFNSSVFEWTYGDDNNSWLSEEEAVYRAETLIVKEKSVKNICVKQRLGDQWFIVDLEKSPFAYHNKKAPTV